MKKEFIDFLMRREKFEERLSVRPVITISRECGCPSKVIAQKIAETLEKKNKNAKFGVQWRWVNKEIITQAAEKLEMDPIHVEKVAKSKPGGLTDILTSFSPLPVSDLKIRKTIADIIKGIAHEGHVIIVGRGGVTLLKDVPNVIHIRLQAPYAWRVDTIRQKYHLTNGEAKKKVKEIDDQRMYLRDYFEGKKSDRSVFDLVFNCKTTTPDEIVVMVTALLTERKLV